MSALTVSSPAKINLFLAVTGRRADGFHELVSLVAPLEFGDSITVRRLGHAGEVGLTCDDPAVPTGAANLAVRAALAFREAIASDEAVAIGLTKRIPMGAGLGGGSSNAAAVLSALNRLHDHALGRARLAAIAATLGSDCPLFLEGAPCVMRGRGERLESLSDAVRRRITGTRVLVFKPDVSISTPWAYGQLVAARGSLYADAAQAEARLACWMTGGSGVEDVLFNSFEAVAFRKFLALPSLVKVLRAEEGVVGVLMSGSGSACVAILSAEADESRLLTLVRDAFGAGACALVTTLL